MALTTQRIVGSQVDVAAASDEANAPSITKWKDYEIALNEKTEDANTSDSTLDEEVGVKKWVEGSISGLLGVANNGATLPLPGDTITLKASVGSDSVIPDLSDYGVIKVKAPVTYTFGNGPASFKFGFRSGRLNDAL